jgi:prefoldin subunit 5
MEPDTTTRFERIEHFTAALAEERCKDREEYKALWRSTQQQIDGLAAQTAQLSARMSELTAATIGLTREMGELTLRQRQAVETVDRLGHRVDQLAGQQQQSDARVDRLTSAIGDLIQRLPRA